MDALEVLKEFWGSQGELVEDLEALFERHFETDSCFTFISFLNKVFDLDKQRVWRFLAEGDEDRAINIVGGALYDKPPEILERFLEEAIPEKASSIIEKLKEDGVLF